MYKNKKIECNTRKYRKTEIVQKYIVIKKLIKRQNAKPENIENLKLYKNIQL